jgi:eukaryotic-like serine/threonine-protein kinase
MNQALKAGEMLGGKYLVERVLGRGGMGVVLAARHAELDAPRAIKVSEHRGVAAERLLHEARITARLTSDHVVRVYDVGQLESGEPYVVMERLQGLDLGELLRRRGCLTIEEAALYVAQACVAMEEAHALGVVHLDLKPANLFLAVRSDGTPCVKVLDFGIARFKDAPSASTKQKIEGSPAYMAPERVILGPTIDARADVWALGVVLYELLTGQVPFREASYAELASQILNRDALPADTIRPDLPLGLAAVISRCLQKSPALRFEGVAALRAALAPFASVGQAPSPGPPGWTGSSGRACREDVTTRDDVSAYALMITEPAKEAPWTRARWIAWMIGAQAAVGPSADLLQGLVALGLVALQGVAGAGRPRRKTA